MSSTVTSAVGGDVQTRRAVVTTAPITHKVGRNAFTSPAGEVTWVGMLGETQVAAIGPALPQSGGKVVGALIEHPTAMVGDVLPMTEVAAAIATATEKQAAVAGQRAAREKQAQEARDAREKQAQEARDAASKEAASSPPLTAAERVEIRKLLAAKPAA